MEIKDVIQAFLERDKDATAELNNWMFGPVTESRRLAFLEGRVEDLCRVVMFLSRTIEDLQSRPK